MEFPKKGWSSQSAPRDGHGLAEMFQYSRSRSADKQLLRHYNKKEKKTSIIIANVEVKRSIV